MKIVTLTVEAYGFGLVTTVHRDAGEAEAHLIEEYGLEYDADGDLPDPGDEGCPDEVEDWSIKEHEVEWADGRGVGEGRETDDYGAE